MSIPEMLAAIVKNQERPGVKLVLDSKGKVKPEVHAYGPDVAEAGRAAQQEFNRLCRAYNITIVGADLDEPRPEAAF